MCFHHRLTHDAQAVANRFKVKSDYLVTGERFTGFTYPETPVITNERTETIQLYRWGLIPSWSKDQDIREYTLNARIESLQDKPSFRDAIVNRCLIVIDGFYEWQWLDAKGKSKQQYLLTIPGDELFALAGIWSRWNNPATGQLVNTYSVITTEANEQMARIHNSKKRMPVILTPANENAWISGEDTREFHSCNQGLIETKIGLNPQQTLF